MNPSSRLVSGVARPRPTTAQYRSSVRYANMPQSAKPTNASADPTVGLHTSSIHLFPDMAYAEYDPEHVPTQVARRPAMIPFRRSLAPARRHGNAFAKAIRTSRHEWIHVMHP